MKDIVLVGAGGQCISCIDIISAEGSHKIIGIIDREKSVMENNILGYKIIGDDSHLPYIIDQYKNIMITVGQIKNNKTRIKLFNLCKKLHAEFPTIISPLAYLSKFSEISSGTCVMHGVILNAKVKIGKNCIINTQSFVDHGSIINNHCHISTGVKINGDVFVDDGTFIGSGSIIREGVHIGKDCIIGAGSVVMKDIKSNTVFKNEFFK